MIQSPLAAHDWSPAGRFFAKGQHVEIGQSASAEAVAWICLGAGLLVLSAGVLIGIYMSLRKSASAAHIDEAEKKLEKAKLKVDAARDEIAGIGRGLEAGGAPDTSEAVAATESAAASAQAAKSAIEQIQGAIASLPVNLRFAGLLVLVGAALISVATVQFGGTSLF